MKLIAAILLLATAVHAWEGGVGKIIDGPEIDGQWIEYTYRKGVPIKKAMALPYANYQHIPTFRIITGTTQQVDEISGETNTVNVSEVVPYGVVRADGTITAPTLDEWGLWAIMRAEQAQAELAAKTAQYAGPLALVLAAFARFQITPPIEYDQAAAIMNQQAQDTGDLKLVIMAKMAYERHLEPAGITGDTLAECAGLLLAQMQGGQ